MAPMTITIDVEQFTRSRDAVVTALLTLSSSLEKAAKEYAVHTNTVLSGEASLSSSDLAKAFSSIATLGSAAETAVVQLADAAADGDDELAGPKKRKPRDPNAPKRPLTAYLRFLGDVRPAVLAELTKNGDTAAGGDVTLVATERWKGMSEEQKQPYHHAYQLAKVEYDKVMEEYNKTKSTDAPTDAAPKPVKAKAKAKPKAAPEVKPAIAAAPVEADSDSTSSEDEIAAPPLPPSTKKGKKASSPEAVKKTPKAAPASTPATEKTPKPAATEKTPKASKKKGAAAPTPIFNSINTAPPAPTTGKKRKSEAAAPETPAGDTDSPAKKRKPGRPVMTDEEKAQAAEKRKAAKAAAA